MRLACFYVGLVACAAPQTELTSTLPTTAARVVASAPPVETAPEVEPAMPPRNAERTIASLRPRLRTCYERGLDVDPRMSGAVSLHARVAPDGTVKTVDVTKRAGLSTSVAACLADKLRATRFDPGGAVTAIDIPVHFVHR